VSGRAQEGTAQGRSAPEADKSRLVALPQQNNVITKVEITENCLCRRRGKRLAFKEGREARNKNDRDASRLLVEATEERKHSVKSGRDGSILGRGRLQRRGGCKRQLFSFKKVVPRRTEIMGYIYSGMRRPGGNPEMCSEDGALAGGEGRISSGGRPVIVKPRLLIPGRPASRYSDWSGESRD